MINPIEHGLPHLIEVKIDPGKEPPETEADHLAYACMDTVWALLREYSVRVTLAEMRGAAKEQGIAFLSDEEMFEGTSHIPGAPTGYLDAASDNPEAAELLVRAFALLAADAQTDAAFAISAQEGS